jgi:hypothetical protein
MADMAAQGAPVAPTRRIQGVQIKSGRRQPSSRAVWRHVEKPTTKELRGPRLLI